MALHRVDVLSGRECLIAEWVDKPLPPPRPRWPEHTSGSGCCALCTLTTGTGAQAPDGRRVHARRGGHVAVENGWPVLEGWEPGQAPGPGRVTGHTELVIAGEHLEGPAQLTGTARTELAALLAERLAAVAERCPHWICFLTVGQDAGGSQPHLHAQVVGASRQDPAHSIELARQATLGGCVVARDRATAAALGCELGSTAGVAAWVATAPSLGEELRLAPEPGAGLGVAGALAWMAWLDAALDGPPMNLVLHAAAGLAPHWHLMVRTSPPGAWEVGCGYNLLGAPPEQLASRLRTHGLPQG